MRKLLFPLLLLVCLVMTSTCRSAGVDQPVAPGGGGGSPCAGGTGNADPERPVVCVDDSGSELSVDRDPVHVHDVMEADLKTSVPLQWFTRTGKDLTIKIAGGCVDVVRCNAGHCIANTRDVAADTKCKYDVMVPGFKPLDPTVIVDNCCPR
ncbi:MAG TPA: hypothetical protein VF824_07115 [Thermoanaerobaculia bacterium]|jgi:hypothetical protein